MEFFFKKKQPEKKLIIGLDVGGTHTDVVLLGKDTLLGEIKVPTDPTDLFTTVLTGLEKITEGIDHEKIARIVLSTTLATNVIVQKKIPPVGMIVSSGPGIDPEFFRTGPHYFAVSGSIDHRGREIEPVDPGQIQDIVRKFNLEGIRNVGVVSKFSVRNPEHELKIKQILKQSVEKVFLGHRISGNLNFPRRISTTYLNAATYPVHREFFQAVKMSLEKKGLSVPIHILKADGGTMNLDASIDFPGQTIFSGPAASVVGSIAFASGREESLVMDIGGTSTDMALLINRVPVLNPLGVDLGAYKTLIRSLETRSIGLGGDSFVRVVHGKLEIGPERLGPAMAYGGKAPTPTDALCIQGTLPDGDRERSLKGIETIAGDLGTDLKNAADLIVARTCNRILAEAGRMIDHVNSKPVYTVHDLMEGHQVNPKRILVLGGPAPQFSGHLEALSNFRVSVVPGWKVANAVGAALARTTCEVTLFADTQLGIATAPEEGFRKRIGKNFSIDDAVKSAEDLVKKKAIECGADIEDLETEVLEEQQFNMVSGFYTSGKNIRVKVQVKPGLLHGYEEFAGRHPSMGKQVE
jgi:N-methylhydantoinase A/oxoprolinase/acetone carboxylase beta subunit